MGYDTLEDFVIDIPDVITCWMSHGQMMTKAVAVKSTEHITSLVARQRNRNRAPNEMHLHQTSREKREPPKPVPQTNSSEYHILRGQIQGLLYAYRSGIRLSQFPEAFAKRFGRYINLSSIGFTNLYELLESLNDITDIKPLAASGDDVLVKSKVVLSAAMCQGL